MFKYTGISHLTARSACKASIVDHFSFFGRNSNGFTLSEIKNSEAYGLMARDRHEEAGKVLRAELARDGWKLPNCPDGDLGLALEDAYYEVLSWRESHCRVG